ncbi:cysteine--tRNA ligase, partial [candidate division CSSED10-310 bacterium]
MIYFYNTLTRKKEKFTPQEPNKVRIYSCGPTVYNRAHIGNLRGFCFADVLRRYLKFKGYKVTHVMNLTDVDDKTIRDSRAEGISLQQFTDRYIELFYQDIDLLNLERVEFYPRATAHIPEMVDLVQNLLSKDLAYQKDGSIYFRIAHFKNYGRLSGHELDQQHVFQTIESDEYDKDDVRDFVLWKGYKEGEPFWETPFGKGRPGWHLECSAMSMKYLGNHFDIHTGGVDLIFPHHENEIAQSEGSTAEPFVDYWLHNEFLLMDTDKMSKSLGNILTLPDLLELGFDPLAIRYFLISVHYRKIIRYNEESLTAAHASLTRLRDFYRRLQECPSAPDTGSDDIPQKIQDWLNIFESALDDDLNISPALAVLFEMVKEINALLDQKMLPQK